MTKKKRSVENVRRPRAGTESGRSPGKGGRFGVFSLRAYVAALLILAVLIGAAFIPAYRSRIEPTLRKMSRVPNRVSVSLDDIQQRTKKQDYGFVSFARSHTFEDAVLLISDDPRDGVLANKLWLAYYLYPRVLVTTEALETDPDISVDFILVTPNFRPDPATGASSGYQLVPASPRAIEYARTGEGR